MVNQFNDVSLMLLNEDRLKRMGLKEGPTLLVLDVIERSKMKNVLAPSNLDNIIRNESSKIRKLLEANSKFAQTVLYKKLDKGLELDRKERCEMIRLLCSEWSDRVFSKSYPSTTEQQKLARDIIDTFPYLAKSEHSNEAAFFNKNSGKGPNHPHSGIIYNHFRNLCHKVPSEKKKFKRSNKTEIMITDEILETAEFLKKMEATSDNYTYITEYIVKCLPLFLTMLKHKKSPRNIIDTFPHLTGYNGDIIILLFEQIKPNFNKHANFNSMCSKGLLFKTTSFCRVEDDNLKGLLRIWMQLNCQGLERKSEEGDAEEQLASALIKWIGEDDTDLRDYLAQSEVNYIRNNTYPSGHILCQGRPFCLGIYSVYISGIIIRTNGNFLKALEVKSHHVLGTKPSSQLAKLLEFIDFHCLKIVNTSSRNGVIKLVQAFDEANAAINKCVTV
ncbi:uncharacterized protein LOC129737993 [Uranotaenia lowii]|uniref:uncharacterized protein LOC129737993 n=1 Tax=Uranotaenia lowii TaxID=190385 RepID=UPI00247A97BE|nr:uncharacterized protein LOC129737993 [Uranotaenia lowii]